MEVAIESLYDLDNQIRIAIENYKAKIEDNEFCVIMVLAGDPLIHNLRRRKFYCWPWLPSPRPNQTVFLYNKHLDDLTKRLWILPNEITMAELSTPGFIVDKPYQSMQRWSRSFFKGTFWKDIRKEHGIKMLSQQEYFDLNSAELRESIVNNSSLLDPDPFDFSKICVQKIDNSPDT
jgi:hypothetical protein